MGLLREITHRRWQDHQSRSRFWMNTIWPVDCRSSITMVC